MIVLETCRLHADTKLLLPPWPQFPSVWLCKVERTTQLNTKCYLTEAGITKSAEMNPNMVVFLNMVEQ